MYTFKAVIDIIGINPFVVLPEEVLEGIFTLAGRNKGHIPVKGTVNGRDYTQTLVRYKGLWRLYINTLMLKNSPGRTGEQITITITYDPADRTLTAHPRLLQALEEAPQAKAVFSTLSRSRQQGIIRYIFFLKSEASVEKNVRKAVDFLHGKGRFAGRDKP